MASGSDIQEVIMPSMGEGITEATLVKWLKKQGEFVKLEEPLLEVSTDKVDTEIPSPFEGYILDVLVNAGDTVPVNNVIAHIGAKDAELVNLKKTKQSGTPTLGASEKKGHKNSNHQTPLQELAPVTVGSVTSAHQSNTVDKPSTTATSLRSSPLVRKMANHHGLDLGQIPGTGLHGRITKRDIESYLASGGKNISVQSAANSSPAASPISKHAGSATLTTKIIEGRETLEGVSVRREKMSKMRQLIADHMLQSVQTSPHVTTVFEIDLHNVVKIREAYKNEFKKREQFNLTFTHFFIHACVQAIKLHPIVNVSVDGYDILWKDSINIGCAVAIEQGLIVPVIKDAGELNLLGVARRLNDIVVRARSKKLTPDDVQGGTFSITNPGMFGSVVSTPIINQPQVAILSIGAIIKRPVVIDDMIAIRPLVQIGLTFDHRVVDGEGGARFLASLKEILENYDEAPF